MCGCQSHLAAASKVLMLAHEFTRERYSTCVTGSSKSSHAEETLGLKGPTCHVSAVSFFIKASGYDLEVSNIRNMYIYIYIYMYTLTPQTTTASRMSESKVLKSLWLPNLMQRKVLGFGTLAPIKFQVVLMTKNLFLQNLTLHNLLSKTPHLLSFLPVCFLLAG